MDGKPLQGKIALITGSSRGIGREIALEMARRGADVAIHYFRNRKSARQVQDEITALGVRAIAVGAHLGKREQITELFAEIDKQLGGLDLLVNNAASGVFRDVLEVDEQGWDWTMRISAQSALWCAQGAVPLMERHGGGRIVNMSSLGSHHTLSKYAMVGTAKGALETLTRYLAVELAPKGILVNAVSPGAVRAGEGPDLWDLHPDKDATLEYLSKRTPLGRLVNPGDVARAVCFLCGPDAAAVVGQVLAIDGGYSVTL